MQIVINLEHVFSPGSNQVDNALSLRNLLEYMVRENMSFLRRYPETPSLYRSGVTYARTRIWEPIPALYKRGKGDCKSLATALCAEYRLHGVWCRPVFRFYVTPAGDTNYHILCQTKTGWEDPSAKLGMGAHENRRFYIDDSYGDDDYLQGFKPQSKGFLTRFFGL